MMRAMLDWAVEGARANLALGHMPTCAVADKAKAEYETTGDVLYPFIRERCKVGEGLTIELNALYREYDSWVMDTKFMTKTPSRSAFQNILHERGYNVEMGLSGEQTVNGISVVPMIVPSWAAPASRGTA